MTKKHWIKLDNAAKIFPAAASGSNTQVFRMSFELAVQVDPVLLQQALNETVAAFPMYQYIMRRGLFWYYLESSDLIPIVEEEHKPPCAPLYSKTKKNLLFEVSYYKNKVNLEVFHVLSDGTGAMFFLSMLITKYLSSSQGIPEPVLPYDASYTQMSDDSFSKYYNDKKRVKSKHQQNSCKLRGSKYAENRIRLITGTVSLDKLRSVARSYNTTITVFLCACLMNAISSTVSLRDKRKPITISVPVNLRTIFPSSSARNFFNVINIGYNYTNNSNELSDVISNAAQSLKTELSPNILAANMNNFLALEHNILARIAPLPLKDIIMRMAYKLSRRKMTAAMSNVGAISIPAELEHLVKSFDVFSGTDCLHSCVCSYQNKLSINFSSPFISADIQQQFFRTLVDMGIAVELKANNTNWE